jgi:hypothetical protein
MDLCCCLFLALTDGLTQYPMIGKFVFLLAAPNLFPGAEGRFFFCDIEQSGQVTLLPVNLSIEFRPQENLNTFFQKCKIQSPFAPLASFSQEGERK